MCFNKEASLCVFLLSFSLAIYLIYRGFKNNNSQDKIIGFLFIPISFIQLLEYFIWLNQGCTEKNSFWSIMVMIILFLQILVF